MTSGSDTASPAERRGLRAPAGSCGTYCKSGRRSRFSRADRPSRFFWLRYISPESTSSSNVRQRASVDLPEPDGPTSATREPAGRLRLTESSARFSACLRLKSPRLRYDLLRFRTSISGFVLHCGGISGIEEDGCLVLPPDFPLPSSCDKQMVRSASREVTSASWLISRN